MISLSPRYDLFRFKLPLHYMPEEVRDKWQEILNREQAVYQHPMDYLNESIKGISIPGISDINIEQEQHSTNVITRENKVIPTGQERKTIGRLGRLNVEPARQNTYISTSNPLKLINKEFKVTFRLNQGFANYFMLYETLFHRICKPINYEEDEDEFVVEILDEAGEAWARIRFYQCLIDGMDGLDLSYDKVDRQTDTFDVTWKFNNINFEILNLTHGFDSKQTIP